MLFLAPSWILYKLRLPPPKHPSIPTSQWVNFPANPKRCLKCEIHIWILHVWWNYWCAYVCVCVHVCVLEQQTLRYQLPERKNSWWEDSCFFRSASEVVLIQCWQHFCFFTWREMFLRVYLLWSRGTDPPKTASVQLECTTFCIYFKRENLHIDNSVSPHWVHWSQCVWPY